MGFWTREKLSDVVLLYRAKLWAIAFARGRIKIWSDRRKSKSNFQEDSLKNVTYVFNEKRGRVVSIYPKGKIAARN